jgi:hypothetical protein
MMRFRVCLVVLLALAAILPAKAAGGEHRLVSEWTDSEFEARRFSKIFIIGIAELTEARKLFEDRFVSHLRGKNIDGVPSHSLVPHLDKVEDRTAVVVALEEMGADAAITVRLVPLDERSEEAWADAWLRQTESDIRIRELVDQTLPLPEKKSKRYGVEVALWESGGWNMIWAARTDTYRRRELEDESAPFVQMTITALRDSGLIP